MRRSTKTLAIVAALALAGLALAVALLGGGGDGPRVVVYSAHAQSIIDALRPEFERETGITVEVIKLGSGDVIQRVLAEKDAPQCDVIWSIAGDQLQGHPELLERYRPPAWKQIAPAYQRAVGDAPWLPYTAIMPVLMVNTSKLAEDQRPRGWADLTAPRFKGKLSSARADKSGSSYMQLETVLALFKERGWDTYRGILANAVLSGSSSAVPRLVNDGEALVGITLEDNAQRYVAGGGPVAIVYPQEGTSTAPDGIALVEGAPHPEPAKRFIAWALSKPVQDRLVKAMGRRSVRVDGAAPSGLPPLSEIKTFPYDVAGAAAHKEEHVKRFHELLAGLGK